ncbi:glycosyltransferase family 2 protein [Haliscomenobacter sp.]|uniref:glycosyltransferase family 2 protein n=1 Tax=Haliscomenobacter sp. TaxID=2717303 RepID=UPI003BAC013C
MSSSNHLPIVSVGVPSYNRVESLERAIDSILAQTYQHLEIVISDNASTDQTEDYVRELMKREPRVRYYRQPVNFGLARNFEYVLEKATGKYFIFLADDDTFEPETIEKYVDFMEANPDYSLVSGDFDLVDEGKLIFRELAVDYGGSIPILRTLKFYAEVTLGSIFHGLMRREQGQRIPFYSTLGAAWHFVASLVYQGKVKRLDFVGYNKEAGGVSAGFHGYARNLGEKKIWGYFPILKAAKDTISEIGWSNRVYHDLNPLVRVIAGCAGCLLILGHYGLVIKPRTWAGKILRTLHIKTPNERRFQKLTTNLSQEQKTQASS